MFFLQMQSAMNAAAQRAFMAVLFQPNTVQMINQFLVLNVTRENIVADTLRELSDISSNDLKKPLKVSFKISLQERTIILLFKTESLENKTRCYQA